MKEHEKEQAAVAISSLSFAYERELVLDHVDLDVGYGEFWAVIGPNGGGKTTLVKLILGLLKPWGGKIKVFDRAPGKARKNIGYVPQTTSVSASVPVSVLDVAMMGIAPKIGLNGIFRTRRDREKALHALDKVQMAGFAAKRMSDLSGGQKQRVLIARAIADNPRLVLLDEPTANVDPGVKFCVYELLTAIGKDATIMVVSHDLSLIAAGVNRLACVNKKIITTDKPEPTAEMLTMLYGEHDKNCPLDAYMRSMPDHFKNTGAAR